MPRNPNQYDFFVSYARADDRDGWIRNFVQNLVAAHQRQSSEPPLTYFFDDQEIRGMDDWRLRIRDALAQSRTLLAFVSPTYFTRPWCRREWKTRIDHEISQHILSQGAMPVIVVKVPSLTSDIDERQVAETLAELGRLTPPRDEFVMETARILRQIRRRQCLSLAKQFQAGDSAFDRSDLQQHVAEIAARLAERTELIRRAAASPSHVRTYSRRFTGRWDELLALRERLQNDGAGVISAVHGLGGIGKTELALTFAHAFAAEYPGGRYEVPCDHQTDLRYAVVRRLGDRWRGPVR